MAGAEMSVRDEIPEDLDLEDYADATDNIVLLQAWIKGHLTRKSMRDIRSQFEVIVTETEEDHRYDVEWKSQNICLPIVQKKRSRKSKIVRDENLELSKTKSQKQQSLLTFAEPCSAFSDVTVVNNTEGRETDFYQDKALTEAVASSRTAACVCGRNRQNTAQAETNSLGDKTDITDSIPEHEKPTQDLPSQDILEGEITLDGTVSGVIQGQLMRENKNNSSAFDDTNLGSAHITCGNLHVCDKKVVVNDDIVHSHVKSVLSSHMDNNRKVSHEVADNIHSDSAADISNSVSYNGQTGSTLVSHTEKAGTSDVLHTAKVDCADVLQTALDDGIGVSHIAVDIGTETAQGTFDESSPHLADSTSFWGADESHTVGLHVDSQPKAQQTAVQGTDPVELREKRHHIAMELLWVQQAIHSRKNYLRLKQQMKATKR